VSLIHKIESTGLAKHHKALVECEFCLKRRVVRWYDNYKKPEHPCNPCAAGRGNVGVKRSTAARNNMSKAQRAYGNGGQRMQSGYIQTIVDTPHPRHSPRKNGKYVFEHILVVEKDLGRFLEPYEIVHHIDNDKLNNSLDNLYVCKGDNISETTRHHNAAHNSAEKLTFSLLKKGLVVFDRKTGQYILATIASEIL
jgi:hypothetical protein